MKRPSVPKFGHSWGQARERDYAVLTAAYRLAPEEAVPSSLIAVIDFLELTPRCPARVIEELLAQLRAWNAGQPYKNVAHVPCPNCGERRGEFIEAAGTITQHAAVLAVKGTVLTVQPKGCNHSSFNLHCTTCEWSWGEGEYTAEPVFADGEIEVRVIPLDFPPAAPPPKRGDLN